MGANVLMFYLFSATILFFSVLAVTSRKILRAAVFSVVCPGGHIWISIFCCSTSFLQECSWHYMPEALWY